MRELFVHFSLESVPKKARVILSEESFQVPCYQLENSALIASCFPFNRSVVDVLDGGDLCSRFKKKGHV